MKNTTSLGSIANAIIAGAEGKLIYRIANLASVDITLHNRRHALSVSSRAIGLAREYQRHFPGVYKDEHLAFHIKLAAYGHDLGRSREIAGQPVMYANAYWSCVILKEMMDRYAVPRRDQLLVLYAVCNHSALPSRRALTASGIADDWRREKQLVLTPLVIGDMADSNRGRVRPYQARRISQLVSEGKALSHFDRAADQNFRNWMCAYSIRQSRTFIDMADNGGDDRFPGTLFLGLKVDEQVCTIERMLSKIDWVANKLHGCENGAQNILGLNFGIEANGQRWFRQPTSKIWLARQ